MSASNQSDQPCGRYPRIGPTACTKWFGPSIIPGPIYASWTTSQPCSIDAGGNIFLRHEDMGISEQEEGTMTSAALSGGDPTLDQFDCLWKETQQVDPGESHGDPASSLGERGNCGGTLYHAGGVLRCRSAGALRSLVRGNGRGTRPGSSSWRPTLRAYSAPLFLHSALFPPNSKTQPVHGRPQVVDSNAQNQSHTPGVGRRAGELKAQCRHRQGGYLHRFKGFEQEKVSCPPVATFRVIGGLGEFPRRGHTAPAGTNRKHEGVAALLADSSRAVQRGPQEAAASSSTRGRGGHKDSGNALLEETPGSLVVELSQEASTEGGRPLTIPSELFAEGSKVGPESPPAGGVAVTPAWCSRNKTRPNGAKRPKAQGEGAVRRGLPQNRGEMSKVKGQGGLTAGRKTSRRANNRRFGAANATSFPCNKHSSSFLPYSLERPVSPERTRAFFYTSN